MSDINDKELLKLAAKAAGIDLQWVEHCTPHACFNPASDSKWWNPLTDDGDALRLAVKLGIVIDTSDGVHAQYIVNSIAYPISEYEFTDIYSTTRRAITRAAAEIGGGYAMSDTNDMRREFDAWANALNFEMHRLNYGYSNSDTDYAWIGWQAATERATALERERCAVVCDERYKGYLNQESMRCATAIRQGGDT